MAGIPNGDPSLFTGAVLRCIVCGFGDTCDRPSPRSLLASRRRFRSVEFRRYRSATGAHRLAHGCLPRRILVVWPIWPSIAPIRPRRPFLTFDNPSLSVVIPYGFSVIRRILCGICAVGFSLLLLCRCRSGDGSLSEALLHSGNFPSDICTSKPIRLRKTS